MTISATTSDVAKPVPGRIYALTQEELAAAVDGPTWREQYLNRDEDGQLKLLQGLLALGDADSVNLACEIFRSDRATHDTGARKCAQLIRLIGAEGVVDHAKTLLQSWIESSLKFGGAGEVKSVAQELLNNQSPVHQRVAIDALIGAKFFDGGLDYTSDLHLNADHVKWITRGLPDEKAQVLFLSVTKPELAGQALVDISVMSRERAGSIASQLFEMAQRDAAAAAAWHDR